MKRTLLLLAALLCVGSAALAQPAPDTFARIKAGKTINVGYSQDSVPFSFVGPDQKPTGFSIDLCAHVIAAIARAVDQPELKVNWVPGTVSERLLMVKSGKLDLECANTSRTLSRMRDVDFSILVFIETGGFLVHSDASIANLAGLNGKKIAVIKGTATEQRLLAQLKARLINAEVIGVRDGPEGMARLETGAADAFASDKIKLIGLASQSKAPERLALLQEDLSFEPYAFALPRGDASFRYEVDRALAQLQLYASPEIDRIFDRWLGKLGRPTGLLAAMYILGTIPE